MRAAITHEQTSATVVPDMAVWPWQESRSSETAVHTTLDGNHWYVLRDFTPSAGTMRLLLRSESAALSAYGVLAVPGTLALENVPSGVDLPAPREFRFVVRSVSTAQAEGGVWVLDVDYQEIAS